MNQLEQLREKIIALHQHEPKLLTAAQIRASLDPEKIDYEKPIAELKTEIAKLRAELTNDAYLRKENEELKESLRFVIEQCEEWQNFATGCEQDDVEEMKLARERAK